MEKFTIEQGKEIQRQDLARWKKVLKPEYYDRLETNVAALNKQCEPFRDGFDVPRGCRINEIVERFSY